MSKTEMNRQIQMSKTEMNRQMHLKIINFNLHCMQTELELIKESMKHL